MKRGSLSAWLILAAMVSAATLATFLRPTIRMADVLPPVSLDSAVPHSFGDWIVDESVVPIPPTPEVERRLDLYYQQTLARTYRHRSSGLQVMLSIAYGSSQTREAQIHRPEVCYASQGFLVSRLKKTQVHVAGLTPIPAMRLVGTHGARSEPITYWVRFGHDVVRGNLEQGFSRMKHGLHGEIPDALLFRVSSLAGDPEAAYALQENFIAELLNSLDQDSRRFVTGQP